ncbi:hypothetical protein EXIGLDRAFT_798639 [Exidia glandulosa HHB12029]|uniref:Uncharacterized protein n=1 Tax=Exidia glandulosa HHB12029 TaxID=1314781 RepID=A0A165F4J7_EXIGL|nr:hypothetical protein EXIGLDRAFT_798639 [Exidia glandulosa HHB12029]
MALSGKITHSPPPTYQQLWEYERRLPQHNEDLPLPEGRRGRYVRFANQVRQKGWNNVLNEIVICTEVARQANRAYVFEHFTWLPRHYPCAALYPWQRGLSWGPRTPLSALIAGPTVGGPWDDDDSARSVSVEYWDQVCPPSERYYISRETALLGLGDKPEGIDLFNQVVGLVRDAPARCVEVGRIGEDPTFDVWLISGNRSLSLSVQFLNTPSSRLLRASPLVQAALLRNEYLFAPRTAKRSSTPAERRAIPATVNLYARMMAVHIRRGDFEGACVYHTNRPDVWYQWNLWPTHPDKFVPPPGAGGGYAPPEAYEAVRKRCFPSQDEIRERIRTVREDFLRSSSSHTNAVLDTMHIMTNGDGDWIDELKRSLADDGWNVVVSSSELKLDDEQTDVSMAVDQEIGRRAAVFIGNGWSSLTSNIVHQRLVDRREPYATRFW